MLQHQPLYALFAGTLSLGLFLMVAGPALRRSRVDMATRLRRLDPDSWRAELAESLPAVGFEVGYGPCFAMLYGSGSDCFRLCTWRGHRRCSASYSWWHPTRRRRASISRK